MAYALKGSSFRTALQSKCAADSKTPVSSTPFIVRSHLSPTQTAKQLKISTGKLASSISAATLLLVSPSFAVQAPSLFEGNTTYQQELQDLIKERGSLPDLPSPPDPSKAAASVKKAVQSSEFKLPDVAKGSVDTPQELADKALPEALKNLPPPPTPTPSSSTPGQPKAEGSKVEAPKLPKLEAPKLEALKLEAPKLEAPKPPSLPTPSAPQPPPLPQQEGGGLPTPYLAAAGVALLAILGIGLAGAKPDQAPSPTASSSGSSAPKSSGGSSGSMPEGKDPELDSEVAKKKDPFFKEVDKRT